MTTTMKTSDQLEYDEMLDVMSFHILESGIHEGWFEKVKESISPESNKANKDFIRLAVRLLYEMEWKAVHTVWTLPCMTPEVWKRFIDFELEDVREYQMLVEARTELYDRFKTIMKM